MDAAVLERAYEAFQEFHGYFAPVFGRKEARENSSHYLQALLVQSEERHNAENLSETVPASSRALQRFLSESPWDDDAVIGRLGGQLELTAQLADAVLHHAGVRHAHTPAATRLTVSRRRENVPRGCRSSAKMSSLLASRNVIFTAWRI